ncbi:MAG: tRNA preQ1(34) S-adenosylmethionine ribosyltransferase-isomerase QueA [Clostridiales bacterium]|jgi:S-adenosylmethionine:tRNA ribosyltransferase-isomerase|nr:tRNA preQ1(34) S-adenosylmethionine ribosyltransferase-isomerase QueA [Clostridiales bacterium]
MKKSDFFYELPQELIAQTPLKRRDESRLMTLDRISGEYTDLNFFDLPGLLRPGDLLVMNNSRVIPARLIGKGSSGGSVELVLLHEEGELWECIVKPGKRCRPGAVLTFGDGKLTAEVESVKQDGNRLIRFNYQGIFLEVLEELGRMPLPPYITETLDEPERYQTVYSKIPGSSAAPTAGLHFTEELIERVQEAGASIAYITLHVGLGTFRPVKEEKIEDHLMHAEYCIIPEETAEAVRAAKKSGNRVIAVGTTSCRTLEAFFDEQANLKSSSGWTDIFIYPGYTFNIVDGLITNFHLPESTLIMLVSAFAGRENVLNAYKAAIEKRMRFFSFGDAMFIS